MLMAPLSWATTSRAADPLFSSRAAADAAEAATLPAGFDDALVTRVGGATALAFTPDGRMLITTKLEVDGSPITAPQTFTSWEGYVFTAKAEPALQGLSGKAWGYASWSDGGARQHTITTPANPTTYTAHYSEARCGGGVWIGGLLTMVLGGLGRLRSRRARARAGRRRAGPAGAGPPPPSAGSRPR